MRVLIVEHRSGEAAEAETRLHEAGHATVSCAEAGGMAPCKGLDPEVSCPIDEAPIDAAIVVAGSTCGAGQPGVEDLAFGYVCASRRNIPTVALGAAAPPAHLPVTTHVVGTNEIVDAVERCAAAPLPRHSRAAASAVREALDRKGLQDVDALVQVDRRDGRLHIRVGTSRPLPPRVSHATSVRALAAVRDVDPLAPAIGVTVET